ncbi:MAG: hypothetical protein COB60_09870 [Flavobacteriaceae bacterium]|nr:MAG: hypothetical protein COB60_09870 [Flavobacteriaceae bacterium]
MRRWKGKILKIIGLVFISMIVVLYIGIVCFSQPKSTAKIETFIQEKCKGAYLKESSFRDFKYRVLFAQKKIDSLKPTLVFVHGSIGSILDFKQYLSDSILKSKVNMVTYDRIGYGIYQTGNVMESIALESALLDELIKGEGLKNTVLIGYSYGGPIAMLSKIKHRATILLAPALFSKEESVPWAVNLYTWKGTRWLMPEIWKAASKEKISHCKELEKIENSYQKVANKVIAIHGKEDWIVPFKNAELLNDVLKTGQFKLHLLPNAGHGLVWSHFNEIKSIILHQLNEQAIEL